MPNPQTAHARAAPRRGSSRAAASEPSRWLDTARKGEASLEEVRRAAAGCRACPLWQRGTQTVFGEGAQRPRLLLVGEQPGDQEDVQGRPFVGPAGRLLDRALAQVGVERGEVWVTNAVKHFKWKPRGKRRIHEKPSGNEVRACQPWLFAEIGLLRPRVVVVLGATAAQALLGPSFRVTRQRGQLLSSPVAPRVVATVHPASILRAPDDDTREREMERFVADLARAVAFARARAPRRPTAQGKTSDQRASGRTS